MYNVYSVHYKGSINGLVISAKSADDAIDIASETIAKDYASLEIPAEDIKGDLSISIVGKSLINESKILDIFYAY